MITLENITLGYGRRILLERVSARFEAGQLTALIGRNGTGKSTLLRAMAGLEQPLGGEISICGEPIGSMSSDRLARRTAFVTTDKVRVANMRCEDLVALGRAPYTNWIGRLQDVDRRIVERSLSLVGMESFAGKCMDTLSDGECQRVMIARALAQQTPVILLDEPTAFLDIGHQLRLMDTARALAGEGRAVVIVLHDLCLALKRADRLAVLAEGSLAALGRPEDIFATGVVDRVFGVSLRRVGTPEGWQYYFA